MAKLSTLRRKALQGSLGLGRLLWGWLAGAARAVLRPGAPLVSPDDAAAVDEYMRDSGRNMLRFSTLVCALISSVIALIFSYARHQFIPRSLVGTSAYVLMNVVVAPLIMGAACALACCVQLVARSSALFVLCSLLFYCTAFLLLDAFSGTFLFALRQPTPRLVLGVPLDLVLSGVNKRMIS
jgi:hypothetical protein